MVIVTLSLKRVSSWVPSPISVPSVNAASDTRIWMVWSIILNIRIWQLWTVHLLPQPLLALAHLLSSLQRLLHSCRLCLQWTEFPIRIIVIAWLSHNFSKPISLEVFPYFFHFPLSPHLLLRRYVHFISFHFHIHCHPLIPTRKTPSSHSYSLLLFIIFSASPHSPPPKKHGLAPPAGEQGSRVIFSIPRQKQFR